MYQINKVVSYTKINVPNYMLLLELKLH